MRARIAVGGLAAATLFAPGVGTPAHASGSPQVFGVVLDSSGLPAANVQVSLRAVVESPAGTTPSTPLADTFELSARTDATGSYAFTIPASTDWLNLLAANTDEVNAILSTTIDKYTPLDSGDQTQETVEADQTMIQLDAATTPLGTEVVGPGQINMQTKAVKQALLDTTSETVLAVAYPTGATPPPTPSDEDTTVDPEDPEVTDHAGAGAGDYAGAVQRWIDATGGQRTSDVVGIDNTTVNTLVDGAESVTGTAQLVHDIRSQADSDGGGGCDGGGPCHPCTRQTYDKDDAYTATYNMASASDSVYVGEVHTSTGSTATFEYETAKDTSFEVGFKLEGEAWSFNGSHARISTKTTSNSIEAGKDWAYRVYTFYKFERVRRYICVGSRSGVRVDRYYDFATPVKWEVELYWDKSSKRDTYDTWSEERRQSDHAHCFPAGQNPSTGSGHGYENSAAFGVFGFSASATTSLTQSTQVTWHMSSGTTCLFGRGHDWNDAPITYAIK
jgi:hypothetical protein